MTTQQHSSVANPMLDPGMALLLQSIIRDAVHHAMLEYADEATHAAPAVTISVDVADAARITSLSQHIIRDAINRGSLPAIRVGERRITILVADLESWIKRHPRVTDPS